MAWLVRLPLLVTIVIPLVGRAPPTAHACSCQPLTVGERFEMSTAVFIGRAVVVVSPPTEIWDPSLSEAVRQYTLEVGRIWKSPGNQRVDVQTARDGPVCGAELVLDQSYLIFAAGVPGRLTMNVCLGVREISQASDLIAALDAALPGAPAAGTGLADQTGNHRDLRPVELAILAAAAAAILCAARPGGRWVARRIRR
jgi:hypothetical protein